MDYDSNSSELYRSLSSTGDVQHIVSGVFDVSTDDMSQHAVDPRFSYRPSLASPHHTYSGHPPSITEREQTHGSPSRFGYLKKIGIRALSLLRSTRTYSSSSVPLLHDRHADSHIVPSPPSTQTATRFLPSQKTATILPRYLEAAVTRFRPVTSPTSFLNLSDGGVTSPLPRSPEPEHYSFFDDLPKSQSTLSLNQFRTHTLLPVVRKARSHISLLFGKRSLVLDSGFVPESSYHYTRSCDDLMCIETSCFTCRVNSRWETHRPSISNECLCGFECGVQHRASDTSSNIMITTVCFTLFYFVLLLCIDHDLSRPQRLIYL